MLTGATLCADHALAGTGTGARRDIIIEELKADVLWMCDQQNSSEPCST